MPPSQSSFSFDCTKGSVMTCCFDSPFRFIMKIMAPNGNETLITHEPYAGANAPAPSNWNDKGIIPHCPVVQSTENFATPRRINITQSHFLFSILVLMQSTKAHKLNNGIRIASTNTAYCRGVLPTSLNLLIFSKESAIGLTLNPTTEETLASPVSQR